MRTLKYLTVCDLGETSWVTGHVTMFARQARVMVAAGTFFFFSLGSQGCHSDRSIVSTYTAVAGGAECVPSWLRAAQDFRPTRNSNLHLKLPVLAI